MIADLRDRHRERKHFARAAFVRTTGVSVIPSTLQRLHGFGYNGIVRIHLSTWLVLKLEGSVHSVPRDVTLPSLDMENIIKMTASTTVVNTNEFFCVPVGKSRQAAIFLGNLVKNAIEEGKRIPKRMEMGSDLGNVRKVDRGHRRPCYLCLLSVLFCQRPRDDER